MVQILHSSGCSQELEIPSQVHCARSVVYSDFVSQPFLPTSVWVFFPFARCVGVTQLASGFLSERIAPCVAVHWVCLWEEGNWGTACVTILVWSLS